MSNELGIRPILNHIIFQFADGFNAMAGKFISATESGIILSGTQDDTIRAPRYGIIKALGPDCSEELQVGAKILIEPMMWTNNFKFNDEKYWRTDDSHVLWFTLPTDEGFNEKVTLFVE